MDNIVFEDLPSDKIIDYIFDASPLAVWIICWLLCTVIGYFIFIRIDQESEEEQGIVGKYKFSLISLLTSLILTSFLAFFCFGIVFAIASVEQNRQWEDKWTNDIAIPYIKNLDVQKVEIIKYELLQGYLYNTKTKSYLGCDTHEASVQVLEEGYVKTLRIQACIKYIENDTPEYIEYKWLDQDLSSKLTKGSYDTILYVHRE